MKSKDTKYYIKSAIGLLIMFGFGQLPPIGPLTPLGMRILGLTGYCTVGEAVSAGFGSEMVWMMMILLVLAAGINDSGLGEILARWM